MQPDPFRQKIFETYHYLHHHAEISWEEKNTTRFIKEQLEQAGCRVRTFPDHTGVIGDLGVPSPLKPFIAIRADMDALWQEVDGVYQANHSCGHDAHMTMALGVLWSLLLEPSILQGAAVRFIFQPAEEVGAGALKMIEKGAADGIDYLFGIHLRPAEETANGYAAPAIVHGATAAVTCEICGEDAHAARPHLTSNAIEVGAHIVHHLNSIHLDPRIPHSAKVTKFRAGGKNTNIIPGQALLAFDLRAQTNELMEELKAKIFETLEAAQSLFQSRIHVTNVTGVAAARVSPEAEQIASHSIARVLGESRLTPSLVTPGGDDFHFYTIKKPDLKATMIGLGCGLEPGLHHPDMTFDPEALFSGIAILTDMIRQLSHGRQHYRAGY